MSFQPRSTNPYIMEKKLNDCVGGGGISNIPIASADTVGGIMIGGSANPITITGSGNASVRKATSELLGVVKAGDGVSVDADGALSGIPYSTTEHKTGRKWIDGKDIYEKVVVLDNAISVSSSWTNLGITNADYDVMIHANGLHEDGSFYSLILDLHNSEQATTLYAKASTSIDVKILVFEYTKPTPTPTPTP